MFDTGRFILPGTMEGVRFELATQDSRPAADHVICKVFVRWADGKRLTNRLPKISLTSAV